MSDAERALAERVYEAGHAISGSDGDYDALVRRMADHRFVLIGEASHGTHEFYAERARLTRRLITEHGFAAVAVEADWPDADRVNLYVRGRGKDAEGRTALAGFERFPTWMWRNTDVLAFVEWLRGHNQTRRAGDRKVGFYGLDLYSLHRSAESVLAYLDGIDPAAAERARYRYGCFDHFAEDSQSYGYAASIGVVRSCEDDAVRQLVELQRAAADYARRDGRVAEEEYFSAEQNARLVKNAEEYYRAMFQGGRSTWNLRDTHMADTLDGLAEFLGRDAKIVVWAHNSHVGDARATQMGAQGELTVGQLVRERHPGESFIVGLTTFWGTVTAASNWDAPAERKRVRPALPRSWEWLFHQAEVPGFWVDVHADGALAQALHEPRLERAIGVIYRPESERLSHYFHARIGEQFDAVVHLDETSEVEPLEHAPPAESPDAPETFPFAE